MMNLPFQTETYNVYISLPGRKDRQKSTPLRKSIDSQRCD
jgi:hypothetical protein